MKTIAAAKFFRRAASDIPQLPSENRDVKMS
jgi:hypothetical protein